MTNNEYYLLWEDTELDQQYTARNNARMNAVKQDIKKVWENLHYNAARPEFFGTTSRPADAKTIVDVMARNEKFACPWVYSKPAIKDLYAKAAESLKNGWNDMVLQAYLKKIRKISGENAKIKAGQDYTGREGANVAAKEKEVYGTGEIAQDASEAKGLIKRDVMKLANALERSIKGGGDENSLVTELMNGFIRRKEFTCPWVYKFPVVGLQYKLLAKKLWRNPNDTSALDMAFNKMLSAAKGQRQASAITENYFPY